MSSCFYGCCTYVSPYWNGASLCCQVFGFPMELGYIINVATGCYIRRLEVKGFSYFVM